MKISKKQLAYALSTLAVFLIALILTVLEWCKIFTLCSHPVFMFFLVVSAGLGVLATVRAFTEKSPFFFFLAAVLFMYLVSYCLADFVHMIWWLIAIVAIVIAVVFVVFSFITAGNKTEQIALNKSPDYKNYEQRRAEREEKEKTEEENYVPPEIKSFKDDNKDK